jgi:hypothetical protein
VLSTAPTSKGRLYLNVPCKIEVSKMAVKALTHLQVCQCARTINPVLSSDSISGSGFIKNAVNHYSESLVYDSVFSHLEPASKCAIRKAYTNEHHIKCITWAFEHAKPGAGQWVRERMALAIRHAMLLRNEDLQNINLSGIFMDHVVDPGGSGQSVNVLVFGMDHSKTNQVGRIEYGLAVRHEDVRRCAVGAMAMYFFDEYEVRFLSFFPYFSLKGVFFWYDRFKV